MAKTDDEQSNDQPKPQQPPPAKAAPVLRVRALRVGHFAGRVIVPGEEFTLDSIEEFGSWMEFIDHENYKRVPPARAAALKKIVPQAPAIVVGPNRVPITPVIGRGQH